MGIDSGYGIGSLKTGVCTTATRPAAPFTGQTIYDTTTATTLVWNGTAWVGIAGGLVCVKAETSFSGTSITADSIFTSSYTNYFVTISAQSTASSAFSMRYRVGGVSAATNYNYQTTNADGTTTTLSQVLATTSTRISTLRNGTANLIYQYIYNPQLAVPTANYGVDTDSGSPSVTIWGGRHTTAAAYDGLEFLSTTSATGTYTVYGLAKTV